MGVSCLPVEVILVKSSYLYVEVILMNSCFPVEVAQMESSSLPFEVTLVVSAHLLAVEVILMMSP